MRGGFLFLAEPMRTTNIPANPSTPWPAGTGFAALLLATAYQGFCAAQPIEFLNQHVLLMDDVFYYFQVARNLALNGWATFDGIHATSGIQLAWGALLWLLALIYDDRVELLRAALVLCVALNACAGAALWCLGRRVYSVVVGDVALLFWSGYMVGRLPTMMGLEYSLHVLTAVTIVALLWRMLVERTTIPRPPWLLGLGALLTFNYWVRLDSALISLSLWAWVTAALFQRRSSMQSFARGAAVLTTPAALGAAAYAVTCVWLAGTVVPISGLVKGHYAREHFEDYGWLTSLAGHAFWWGRIESRTFVDVLYSSLLAGHRALGEPVPLLVLGLIVVITGVAVRILRLQRSDPRWQAARFVGILWLISSAHALLVVATIGHFSHVTQHYYAWLWVTGCLWLALVVQGFLSWLPSAYAQRRAVAALLGVFVVAHIWNGVRPFVVQEPPRLHNRRLPVMEWMRTHLPADARIGAWNAGQLGYFSDRTIVNLDGLVNDEAYLRRLVNRAPVRDYLEAEGIQYLIDVNEPDLTMPYRVSWDRSLSFRRVLPWSALEVLYAEVGNESPIVVLRVRDVGRD